MAFILAEKITLYGSPRSPVHARLHQISFYYDSLSLKTIARMVQLKPVSDQQKPLLIVG